MAYLQSFIVGLISAIILNKIAFIKILNTIWEANKGILTIIKSELSDENKRTGILVHSSQLFKASCKLLLATMLILCPSVILYWNVQSKLEESHFILWVSLVNLIGIFVGLYLFPKRK